MPIIIGLSVMLLLVPTGLPSKYRTPVFPDNVTATSCLTPVLKVELVLICCSLPPPLVVMLNRNVPVLPFCGVRNMFVVVPLPKSKIRAQFTVELSRTHATMVKLLKVPTIPAGRFAYCDEADVRVN